MKLAINVLCGERMLWTLLLDGVLTSSIMLGGAVLSLVRSRGRAFWVCLGCAWVATAVSWSLPVSQFLRLGDRAPDFVTWIVLTQVVLFNSFGALHLLDHLAWKRGHPARSLVAYNALSMVSKTLLVALVLSGVAAA